MRHPNPCKFGPRCTFKMKEICLYSHEYDETDDTKKVDEMEKKLKIVEKERKSLSMAFSEFTKKVENKFEILENKIELQRKALEEKDDKILDLENRLNSSIEKIKVSSLTSEKFKCDLCAFTSISEAGLKTHTGKKHKDPTVTRVKVFPQQCDFCELTINDKKQFKIHMRTHSYSLVQYRCDLCDFMGYDEIDMDVHAAKLHSDKSECGLCGFKAKDL